MTDYHSIVSKHTFVAISPLDGRYWEDLQVLSSYFSELALFRYRIRVETEYVILLSEYSIIPSLTMQQKKIIRSLYTNFDEKGMNAIKQIEKKTHHDMKAVEYYLQKQFKKANISSHIRFIHYGVTSDDINNIAYSLMLKDSLEIVLLPQLEILIAKITSLAKQYANSPLLARTHSQPAIPTTFGKELLNFSQRIIQQKKALSEVKLEGKLNGAVGSFQGLALLHPTIDWIAFSEQFIQSFSLLPNICTTQILPYDSLLVLFHHYESINSIFIGFCQDIWLYCLLGEVTMKTAKGQVGSSTMPQKINPIQFENAEGNLFVANSYWQLYARKLAISRLQRDLSDSTIKRTFGTAISHTLLAWESIEKGLESLIFREDIAKVHLNEHWEILAEALQLYLRKAGDKKGYEIIKTALQGKTMNQVEFQKLIQELHISAKEIEAITPQNYTGLASKIINLSESKL